MALSGPEGTIFDPQVSNSRSATPPLFVSVHGVALRARLTNRYIGSWFLGVPRQSTLRVLPLHGVVSRGSGLSYDRVMQSKAKTVNEYLAEFEKAGMIGSGINPENKLVEIVELKDHPWFVGVQFHPEYKSTVANPHPFFVQFVKAAVELRETVPN